MTSLRRGPLRQHFQRTQEQRLFLAPNQLSPASPAVNLSQHLCSVQVAATYSVATNSCWPDQMNKWPAMLWMETVVVPLKILAIKPWKQHFLSIRHALILTISALRAQIRDLISLACNANEILSAELVLKRVLDRSVRSLLAFKIWLGYKMALRLTKSSNLQVWIRKGLPRNKIRLVISKSK